MMMIKDLPNFSSIIKVAVVMVVIVFMTSWVTETYAKGKQGLYCDDAWNKQLEKDRFMLVMPTEANPDGEAVLDGETCLVWEQAPDAAGGPKGDGRRTLHDSLKYCFTKRVGDQMGWRVPTIEELATLLDITQQEGPTLPSGHPFTNVQTTFFYWSSTTDVNPVNPTSEAWVVDFFDAGMSSQAKGAGEFVWCVRGGQGHDAL